MLPPVILKERKKNDGGENIDKFQQCFNGSQNKGTLMLSVAGSKKQW